MSKVIPILPYANIDQQCSFYESIGFTTIAKYKAPNAYAVVQYEDIILHFWGSKKHIPEHNASCVFIEVDDADVFCNSIKKTTGKVPRTALDASLKHTLSKRTGDLPSATRQAIQSI